MKFSRDSCAIEYFKGNDLPKEFSEVERDTWFDTVTIKHQLIVRELSIPLPFYRQVLSVIWLYEDEDEIENWIDEYNEQRPHESLRNLTPRECMIINNQQPESTLTWH
jgi:transposase InsO family protein